MRVIDNRIEWYERHCDENKIVSIHVKRIQWKRNQKKHQFDEMNLMIMIKRNFRNRNFCVCCVRNEKEKLIW